jgi:hypothetical protein
MKEPGLDNRHRDQAPPKAGQIQQKRSDTLNKNLPQPIPQFFAECEARNHARRDWQDKHQRRASSGEAAQ